VKALSALLLAACWSQNPQVTAVTAISMNTPASVPTTIAPDSAPEWAHEPGARFEQRDGKRVAVAVATVKMANPALARDTAANRARASLLRLLQNKGPNEPVEGTLEGSRIVRSETIGQTVAVEVEVAAP